MSTKSPARKRRVIYSTIVGGVVGASLAIVGLLEYSSYIGVIFIPFGALIAGATASLSPMDFEED